MHMSSIRHHHKQVDVYVNNGAIRYVGGVASNLKGSSAINKMGSVSTMTGHAQWSTGNTLATAPNLEISKVIYVDDPSRSPDGVRVYLSVNNTGGGTSYDTTVSVDLTALGLRIDYNTIPSTFPMSSLNVILGEVQFDWNIGTLAVGSIQELEFTAFPTGSDGRNLASGNSIWATEVYYNATSVNLGPTYVSVCIRRVENKKENIFYQHGFTALTFFIMFFATIAVVVLIAFLCLRIRRKRSMTVKVDQSILVSNKQNHIMMDANLANKKTGHTIIDYSSFNEDDTIVGILAIKDNLRRFREIDSLDIVCTINIDTELEQQRNEACINGTNQLINGLVHNRDVHPGMAQVADNVLKKKRTLLNNNLDEEYKRQMKKLYKKLSAKNKAKMSRTLQRQRDEKKRLASEIADLGDKERQQLQDMLEKQHQTEIDEETYKLKLEQDEETENLRKEFAIRKRMGMKEIQQEMLDEVVREGQLSHEKADWLIKEHRETQKKIDNMYDEEIARQRLVLEEKLERRKALAKAEEQQQDDHSDLLNTMASQQIELVQKGKAKKHGALSPEAAAEMIDQAKQNMIALKTKMDSDREKQEAALRKKLGDLKKKQLNNLKNEQKADLQQFEREMETQTDGPIDPVTYADNKLKLQSQHRQELNKMENEIDEEHADKLKELNENLVEYAKEQLERGEVDLANKMKTQCDIPPERYEELMENHKREVERLQQQQRKAQEKQQLELQEKLSKRRKEWEARKEQEKFEQLQLREREEKVISKLVNNQMSMSEEERDRIMKEHEKQMVKIENSLTLNKLRQKKMLEEKLSQKRAEQMEKLQQKHTTEAERKKREMEHNAEESDEESQKEKLEMMKRQFSQKMAIIQGQKLDIDDELETVKVEMMKSRALALKDQEERLGAMVAALQVSKARELSKIEEQQKAINSLKSNLMDDLTERGILSNPECQAVLQRHKQAQDDLNKRVEQQRSKQEKLLKKRLQEKLAKKEEVMLAQQENEIRELLSKQKNKTALKIKKVLLVHKHMVAMEAFRNQLDREITQTLEDIRRKFEMDKLRETQKQATGLIRVGGFSQDELVGVLHMLFPYKRDAEIKEMLNNIYDPKQAPQQTDEKASPKLQRRGSLVDRVRDSQLSLTSRSVKKGSLRDSKRKLPPPPSYKEEYDEEEDRDYSYLDARPEPIGEYVEAQRVDDHQPPGRLPPLETPKKKRRKKKKVLKKLSHQDEGEEDGF
ncbi:hypothetical protein FSP39_021134 [Pinctada imbricata]|uniref:Uncharacterized protein n=1 Tax=Pinctada imbricata TaxID=66713 RepID=A0AA88YAA4_PINIB|nr:hypothetical protein FSP39_021134 [Pinctada imbricata]